MKFIQNIVLLSANDFSTNYLVAVKNVSNCAGPINIQNADNTGVSERGGKKTQIQQEVNKWIHRVATIDNKPTEQQQRNVYSITQYDIDCAILADSMNRFNDARCAH